MRKIIICIFLLFATNNIISANIPKEEMDTLNQDPVIQADKMRTAIKTGANVDSSLWRSALISDGVHFGNTKMAEILLKEFKASPNMRHDKFGNKIPLMSVVSGAMLNLLMQYGADINAQNLKGETVSLIKTRNWPNAEVIYALIKAGANVNIREKDGRSALESPQHEQKDLNTSTPEGEYLENLYSFIVKMLKQAGAQE